MICSPQKIRNIPVLWTSKGSLTGEALSQDISPNSTIRPGCNEVLMGKCKKERLPEALSIIWHYLPVFF